MFGLIFYGKSSDTAEEHPAHEAGPLGWVPYAILGAATVFIGILAPFLDIDDAFERAATSYLQGLYPNAVLQSVPATFSFNVESAGIAFVFVLSGVGAAYWLYIARRAEPSRLVGQTGMMHGLYRFLENRWYLNALYYRVFVDPLVSASRWLLDGFELPRPRTGELGHGGSLGVPLSSGELGRRPRHRRGRDRRCDRRRVDIPGAQARPERHPRAIHLDLRGRPHDNPRPLHPGNGSPRPAMSYVLSLLVLIPLVGSGATSALSSLGGGRRRPHTWRPRSRARRSSSPPTPSGRSTPTPPRSGSTP